MKEEEKEQTGFSLNLIDDPRDSMSTEHLGSVRDSEVTLDGVETEELTEAQQNLQDVQRKYKNEHANDGIIGKMFRLKPVHMYFAEAAANDAKYKKILGFKALVSSRF